MGEIKMLLPSYRDLLKRLATLSEEQLNQTITIQDMEESEFFAVTGWDWTEETDVLDSNHFYLTVKDN